EDGVHGLAHRLVAAERERQVGYAAGDVDVRQVRPDPVRRLDEGDAVAVVLLHPGRDGENVGIEDDVLGREADLLDENVVGALGDRALALERVAPAPLLERHPHPPPPPPPPRPPLPHPRRPPPPPPPPLHPP